MCFPQNISVFPVSLPFVSLLLLALFGMSFNFIWLILCHCGIIFTFSDYSAPPPICFLGIFWLLFLSHTIYVCIICLTCLPILSFSKVGSISDFYLWTGHRPRAVTLCAVEAQYVFIKWRNNESLSFVLHQEFCTNNTSTLSLWRGKL